jgi:DTW domain-containing protein YfiP
MSTRIDLNDGSRCRSCFLLSHLCVCAEIPSLKSSAEFLIIRHIKERFRTSNTARLSALAIPGTKIVDYGAPDSRWESQTLDVPDPVLLFPDTNAPPLPYVPATVIVVDGSWPQARRMVQRIEGLAALPRLNICPPERAPRRLRKVPNAEGMSTIEAIARALDALDGPGSGAPLDMLFDHFVRASLQARGTPIR